MLPDICTAGTQKGTHREMNPEKNSINHADYETEERRVSESLRTWDDDLERLSNEIEDCAEPPPRRASDYERVCA